MTKLQLAIYARSTDLLLADWSERAEDVKVETGEHGFGTLTAVIPLPPVEAFRWYSRSDAPLVRLNDGPVAVWEGRLEDPALLATGIRITALGSWRALSDVPYSAVWSDTRVDAWIRGLDGSGFNATPDRFQFDGNDRLYIAPRKGELHDPANIGLIGYAGVDGGARQLVALDFDYAFAAPADWDVFVERRDDAWTTLSTEWTLTGDGTTQTGTETLTFTGSDRLVFGMHYTTGTADYTGETGDVYLEVTNVRVRTTTGDVSPDAIATALAAYVAGVNASHLSSSTRSIEATGLDLMDEVYEDMLPGDILTRLARLGDGAGLPWEVGVQQGQRLYLRPRGSAGRTWYVDAEELEVERSLDPLVNSAYATYQASGGTLRTAIASNTASIRRSGLTRRRSYRARTTDVTQAETERDAFLSDRVRPIPRAGVTLDVLRDATGALWPLWSARNGDTITIRNLPPTPAGSIDRIRTFRISETRYQPQGDRLMVVPESPIPSLDILLARAQELPQ